MDLKKQTGDLSGGHEWDGEMKLGARLERRRRFWKKKSLFRGAAGEPHCTLGAAGRGPSARCGFRLSGPAGRWPRLVGAGERTRRFCIRGQPAADGEPGGLFSRTWLLEGPWSVRFVAVWTVSVAGLAQPRWGVKRGKSCGAGEGCRGAEGHLGGDAAAAPNVGVGIAKAGRSGLTDIRAGPSEWDPPKPILPGTGAQRSRSKMGEPGCCVHFTTTFAAAAGPRLQVTPTQDRAGPGAFDDPTSPLFPQLAAAGTPREREGFFALQSLEFVWPAGEEQAGVVGGEGGPRFESRSILRGEGQVRNPRALSRATDLAAARA